MRHLRHAFSLITLVLGSAAPDTARAEISTLLGHYLHATDGHSTTQALILRSRIETEIFSKEKSTEYRQNLLQIDRLAQGRHSAAIFELARALQFHWESHYGNPIRQAWLQSEENGAKIGLSLGILALATSLLRQPGNTPKYFQILRHLLPLAGAELGAASGKIVAHRSSGQTPPSPASLMHLGLLEGAPQSTQEKKWIETAPRLSASVAAGSITAEFLKSLTALRSANLLVFALSTAVGVLAENGIEQAVDWIQTQDLQERAHRALVELQLAHPGGNPAHTHAATERFVLAVTDLQNRMNQPLVQAIMRSPAESPVEWQLLAEQTAFQNDPESFDRQPKNDRKLAQAFLRKGFSPNIQRMLRQSIAYLNCLELPYLSDQVEILEALLKNQMELFR